MLNFMKKTRIGKILADKKIKVQEKEKLIDLALAQSIVENQNGLIFLGCGLAKGVILEFLNKLVDDKAISHNKYNEYRDMILDNLTPDRCEVFINDFYLEGEKRWEKRKAEQEEFEKSSFHGVKVDQPVTAAVNNDGNTEPTTEN